MKQEELILGCRIEHLGQEGNMTELLSLRTFEKVVKELTTL